MGLSPEAVLALQQALMASLPTSTQSMAWHLGCMDADGLSWGVLNTQFQTTVLDLLLLEVPHLTAIKMNVMLSALSRIGMKWSDLGVPLAEELGRVATKLLDPSQASAGNGNGDGQEVHRKCIVAFLMTMGAPRVWL